MKIVKVLNNNAVVSANDLGEDIILKGKGIAYKKKAGDKVDDNLIEQIFVSSDNRMTQRYHELLLSIPYECIEICDRSVDIIKSKIRKNLSNNLYLTLTDHIASLIERMHMGIIFDNSLLWDIKRTYKEEYLVGLEVVDFLRKQLDLNIPDDEASFIALHIVNSETCIEENDATFNAIIIEDISDILSSYFNDIDKDSLNYDRFIIHMRFMLNRISQNESIQIENTTKLMKTLSSNYPKQYECLINISKYLEKRFSKLNNDENLYLMIHLIRLTTREVKE